MADRITVNIFTLTKVVSIEDNTTVVGTNYTNTFISFALVDDFFVEPTGVTIVIEENTPQEYSQYIRQGNRLQLKINGSIQFDGFIFKYDLSGERHGTKLTIEAKDLLEFMAQGSIPPNLYGPLSNSDLNQSYHFPPEATLLQCIRIIAAAFNIGLLSTYLPKLKVSVSDNGGSAIQVSDGSIIKENINSLDIATGFAAGLRVSGKKSAEYTKSWNKALSRFNQPEKGETYLAMMKRFTKLSGASIKMAPGSADTIVIQAPTYERTNPTPFSIIHLVDGDTSKNNVLTYKIQFDLNKTYSAIVMEGNSLDEEEFHLNDHKCIAINELTGFDNTSIDIDPSTNENLELNTINQLVPLPSVLLYILSLTPIGNKPIISGGYPLGSNYTFLPFDTEVYEHNFDLQNFVETNICLPFYDISHNAHNIEQLRFECAQKMAEIQDKAVEFIYTTNGLSQNGAIWRTNMMCNVTEGALNTNHPIETQMWIKKVILKKDRSGTFTEITLSLPYTHRFELTDDPITVIPKSSEANTKQAKPIIDAVGNEIINWVPSDGVSVPTPNQNNITEPWYLRFFL